MKEEALAYFKANASIFEKNYLKKENQWIYEKYESYKGKGVSPFEEFKLEVPDFQLDVTEQSPAGSDYKNVSILYKALKHLSNTQAADERLWTGLAHSNFWSYMQYRCELDKLQNNTDKILRNYFFKHGNKRSLILHPLARLWWVGRLTYDESNPENPLEALEYLKTRFSGKVLPLFSRNFTNNPLITRAILTSISKLKAQKFRVGQKEYQEILRYVNALGGIIILDYLSEEELQEKIISHYHNLYSNPK